MNRRNAIKAAFAGLAAAVGWRTWRKCRTWRVCVPGPIQRDGNVVFREFAVYDEADFEAVELGEPIVVRKCWECDQKTADVVCHHCGFDSGPQPDGGFLVPPRFNAYMEQLCNANRT